jgi:hypothetical protein
MIRVHYNLFNLVIIDEHLGWLYSFGAYNPANTIHNHKTVDDG